MPNAEQYIVWFMQDKRVNEVVEYNGFVPDSHKWKCPRLCVYYDTFGERLGIYDAKCLINGSSPWLVGFSKKDGRIFSI